MDGPTVGTQDFFFFFLFSIFLFFVFFFLVFFFKVTRDEQAESVYLNAENSPVEMKKRLVI